MKPMLPAVLAGAALLAAGVALAGNPVGGIGVSVETENAEIIIAQSQTDMNGSAALPEMSPGNFLLKYAAAPGASTPMVAVTAHPANLPGRSAIVDKRRPGSMAFTILPGAKRTARVSVETWTAPPEGQDFNHYVALPGAACATGDAGATCFGAMAASVLGRDCLLWGGAMTANGGRVYCHAPETGRSGPLRVIVDAKMAGACIAGGGSIGTPRGVVTCGQPSIDPPAMRTGRGIATARRGGAF